MTVAPAQTVVMKRLIETVMFKSFFMLTEIKKVFLGTTDGVTPLIEQVEQTDECSSSICNL